MARPRRPKQRCKGSCTCSSMCLCVPFKKRLVTLWKKKADVCCTKPTSCTNQRRQQFKSIRSTIVRPIMDDVAGPNNDIKGHLPVPPYVCASCSRLPIMLRKKGRNLVYQLHQPDRLQYKSFRKYYCLSTEGRWHRPKPRCKDLYTRSYLFFCVLSKTTPIMLRKKG